MYFLLYDRVVYFGGSEAPFLYMKLCIMTPHFWTYILMKNTYDDRYLFTCVNVFVNALSSMKQIPI